MKVMDQPGIHVYQPGWKKRGYKGRVEVRDKNGKFISAHKTVREAIDSVPSVRIEKKCFRCKGSGLSGDWSYFLACELKCLECNGTGVIENEIPDYR